VRNFFFQHFGGGGLNPYPLPLKYGPGLRNYALYKSTIDIDTVRKILSPKSGLSLLAKTNAPTLQRGLSAITEHLLRAVAIISRTAKTALAISFFSPYSARTR